MREVLSSGRRRNSSIYARKLMNFGRVRGIAAGLKGRSIKVVGAAVISFVSILCCAGISPAQQGTDARISRVRAESTDSVSFQVEVAKTQFAEKEDIPLSYLVENHGAKNVYLVVEPSPNVIVKDIWILELTSPVHMPNAHDPFNYDLIKIAPGKSYQGKFVIKAEKMLNDANYNFESAAIQVGFSYLFDVSNLKNCKQAEYTLPCLSELYNKSKPLTVGNLVIGRGGAKTRQGGISRSL